MPDWLSGFTLADRGGITVTANPEQRQVSGPPNRKGTQWTNS